MLILIIAIVIFAPFLARPWLPKKISRSEKDIQDLEAWYDQINQAVVKKTDLIPEVSIDKVMPFDPNVLTVDDWTELGFDDRVAIRINRYISAGGHFEKASDLFKIYAIDSSLVELLSPKMIFPTNREIVANTNPDPKPELTKTAPPLARKNINAATHEDLKTIRGIGDKLSERIINYGELIGGYHHPDQLHEVWYLHDSIIPIIHHRFTFDSSMLSVIPINTDSIHLLSKHPYLNYNQARAIVNYRIVHGDYTSPEQLKEVKILPDSTILKLMPYLSIKD